MSIDVRDVDTDRQVLAQDTQSRIVSLLAGLPPETLTVVERFVEFLREQARQGQSVTIVSEQPAPDRVPVPDRVKERPPYHYPTISLPASARWSDRHYAPG